MEITAGANQGARVSFISLQEASMKRFVILTVALGLFGAASLRAQTDSIDYRSAMAIADAAARTKSLETFVAKYPVAVIDCWAPWCGPCRMVAPVIEELSKELTGSVAFGKLNTDENASIPNKYRISAIPTLLVFKQGKMVDRIVGAQPKETLAGKIKKNL